MNPRRNYFLPHWSAIIAFGVGVIVSTTSVHAQIDQRLADSLGRIVQNAEYRRATSLSFYHQPYINPNVIKDMTEWLSDVGDQVVSINLIESQNSNRYFGDTKVSKDSSGKYPYVYVEEKSEDTNAGSTRFGYRYVGATSNGIQVIRTEGGDVAGIMLLTMEPDTTFALDGGSNKLVIKPRLLLKKWTLISLSYQGSVKIDGNKLTIHDVFWNPPNREEENYSIDLTGVALEH